MRATLRKQKIRRIKLASSSKMARIVHSALDEQFEEMCSDIAQLEKIAWPAWITSLTGVIKDALALTVQDLYGVEIDYWSDKGQPLKTITPQDIIDAYEVRVGRQIAGIADTTKRKTLDAITDWYNSDGTTDDLIEKLKYWYSEERAAAIANTETAFVASQVSYNTMESLGIEKFNIDIGANGCREICLPKTRGNPYMLGAPMPPFHTHCDCGVGYVRAV